MKDLVNRNASQCGACALGGYCQTPNPVSPSGLMLTLHRTCGVLVED